MDLSALQALLDRVAGARVACVGDAMVGRTIDGEVARVPPGQSTTALIARMRA